MVVKKQNKKVGISLKFLKKIKPMFKNSDKFTNDEKDLVIKHMKCIKDYREIKDYYFGSDSDSDSDNERKTIFSVKKKTQKKKTPTKKKI